MKYDDTLGTYTYGTLITPTAAIEAYNNAMDYKEHELVDVQQGIDTVTFKYVNGAWQIYKIGIVEYTGDTYMFVFNVKHKIPDAPTEEEIKAALGNVTVSCVNPSPAEKSNCTDCVWPVTIGKIGKPVRVTDTQYTVDIEITVFVGAYTNRAGVQHNLASKDTLTWVLNYENGAWVGTPKKADVDNRIFVTHEPKTAAEIGVIAKDTGIDATCETSTRYAKYGLTTAFVYYDTDVTTTYDADEKAYVSVIKTDKYVDAIKKDCDKMTGDNRDHELTSGNPTVTWKFSVASVTVENGKVKATWKAEPATEADGKITVACKEAVDVNVYIIPVDSGEKDSLLVNDVKLNAATLARIGLKAYETDEDGEAIDRILVGKYASKYAATLTADIFDEDFTDDVKTAVTNELSGFQKDADIPDTFNTNNILSNTTWTWLSVEGEENFLSGNLPLYSVRFVTEDEANVKKMPTTQYTVDALNIYDFYTKGETIAAPAEDPTRTGYTFDGWYAPGATKKFNFATDTVTGDLVLTAKWVQKPANVHFVIYKSDNLGDKQWFYNVPYTADLADLTGGKLLAGGDTLDLANLDAHDLLKKAGKDFSYEVDGGWYDDGRFNEFKNFVSGKSTTKPSALSEMLITGNYQNVIIVVTETYPVVYFNTKEDLDAYQNLETRDESLVLFSTTARKGATLPTAGAPTATREGYTFLYWSREGQTSDVSQTEPNTVNGWTNLYANWEKSTYTVTFAPKGGTVEEGKETKKVTYGEQYGELPTPTREDYKFEGWYSDENYAEGTEVTADTLVTIDHDHTLYAKWTELCTVQFVIYRNGDLKNAYKTVSLEKMPKGTIIDLSQYEIKNYYTANYTNKYDFYGWYNDNGRNTFNPASPAAGLKEIKVNGWTNIIGIVYDYENVVYFKDQESYEKYQNDPEHKYTEAILKTTTARWGSTLPTADAPTATRTGYTFLYWNHENQAGDVTGKTVEGWTNLIANWKAKTIKVTFDTNAEGVTVTPSEKYVTYDAPYDELPTPTRTGYDFAGWYLSETEFTEANKVEAGTTVKTPDDHTLYANWTAKTIKVNFDANGGKVTPTDKEVKYDALYGTLPTPTRTGYTFNGWYLDGNKITAGSTVKTAKDHTLTASWSINSYRLTIKYLNKSNGKVLAPEYSQKHDYNATVKVESPSIPGYKFYDRDDETVVVTMPDEDVTRIVYYVRKTGNGGGTYDSPNKTKKTSPALTLNTADHFAFINGYPDGSVQPEGNVTRAETAAILYRIMGDDCQSYYKTTSCSYSDVARGDWFNTYVATLENAGVIVDTRTNGKFRPNDAITRAELASMIAQFAGLDSASAASFNDVGTIYWAAKEIAIAAKMGWINGYPDGSFRPNQNVTRAELMAMVNRALGRTPKSENDLLSGMKTWRDNANVNAWYYLDVQEATNDHTYTKSGNHETWKKLL